jgi:RNA polymerase sigma-70 factor, ECF subfamily
LTDAELLQDARSGDAEAWRRLYQRYLPAVWRHAYARTLDIHAAEDVSSEAMLALLRNIREFETGTPNIAGWLRSVVDFKAADHFRKQTRNRDRLQELATQPMHRQVAAPSAALETGETRDLVLKIMDQLPERQREVLECKYLEALSVQAIASRLGETEKAVESHLYRGRREFRRRYDLLAAEGAVRATRPQIGVDEDPTRK